MQAVIIVILNPSEHIPFFFPYLSQLPLTMFWVQWLQRHDQMWHFVYAATLLLILSIWSLLNVDVDATSQMASEQDETMQPAESEDSK